MSNDLKKILAIAEKFHIDGTCTGLKQVKSGHINYTYHVTMEKDGQISELLFQRINTTVFPSPEKLMQNIAAVTGHLQRKIREAGGDVLRETLTFFETPDGKNYYKTDDGEYWRVCNFISDTYSCDAIESPRVFFNAGAAFGKFQGMLSDFPGASLHETIPDFHNTAKRYEAFEKAVSDDLSGRADAVREQIDFVRARKDECGLLVELTEQGELPVRVTHNDTKLNNILFDTKTDVGICVVDLDTVMPGLSLYDFGDSIRFGANTAAEDETDLSKVSLDLNLYENYVNGYLSTAFNGLTEKEIELLPFSAKLMTYECGMRFLTDYLNGDTYFRIDYPEHNRIRCLTQFALVADIEKKFEDMRAITDRAAAALKKG